MGTCWSSVSPVRPDIVLMASGSEVGIVLQAQQQLQSEDHRQVRVVSMPSHELFVAQPAAYRATVLPAGVPRVAIEAAHSMSWDRFLGDRGVMIGIDHFGASAPFQRIYDEFGLTVTNVVARARELLGRSEGLASTASAALATHGETSRTAESPAPLPDARPCRDDPSIAAESRLLLCPADPRTDRIPAESGGSGLCIANERGCFTCCHRARTK